MVALSAGLVPLACVATAAAADVHVDGRNGGATDGSAARPHRSIQAAVNAAAPGDVIKIARGTYAEAVDVSVPNLSFEGGYVGASGDVYAGGGAGDFVTRDTMDPQTVVASGGGIAVFSFVDAGVASLSGLVIRDGSLHGVFADGDPPNAHSLTITRCTIEDSGTTSENGGGIYADVPLTVRESVVRNNVGERGAGIAAEGGSLVLEVSLVEGNVGWGDHGGGVYAYGNVRAVGNVIRGNRTGEGGSFGWGGGIIVFGEQSVAELRGNLVTGNRAPTEGSGTFIDDGAVATIVNELIVANQCPSQAGAGLYVDGSSVGSTVSLTNVTIAGHPCSGGNAILVERSSSVTATSSIFWGNGGSSFRVDPGSSLTVAYSDVEEGWPGTGNISADPLFAGGSDYHLASTSGRPSNAGDCVVDGVQSPAIDAGDPAGAYGAEPSPNGGRVDMGAYGNTSQAGCVDGSGSSSSSAVTTGSGDPTTTSTVGAGGADATTTTSSGGGGAGSGTGTGSSGDGSTSAGGDGGSWSTGADSTGANAGPPGLADAASGGGTDGDDDGPGGDGGSGGDDETGWDDGDGEEGDARTGCAVAHGTPSSGGPLAAIAAALLGAAGRLRRRRAARA